jgi:hypothetical protein
MLLELFAPAMDHGGGQAKLATHLLNRRISLVAFHHCLEFELGCILFFLRHLFSYLLDSLFPLSILPGT